MRIPYWPLLIGPSVLYVLGFAMNAVVMGFNYGQMPVLAMGCSPRELASDSIHTCMVASTHLKVLSDWIVISGLGTASPGDFLEWFYQTFSLSCWITWAMFVIRDLNAG